MKISNYRPTLKSPTKQAFTMIELLLVIGIIGILTSMLMPTISKTQARARQVQCLANLKEIGNGFHLWANDHQSQFPMLVKSSDGGTFEWWSAPQKITVNAFHHLQALSNELTSTKILICPSDNRIAATNWAGLRNTNLSYFVWLPSRQNISQDPLAGDRNIGWKKVVAADGRSSSDVYFWQTNLHVGNGNILFGDGRVSQVGNEGLQRAIQVGLHK